MGLDTVGAVRTVTLLSALSSLTHRLRIAATGATTYRKPYNWRVSPATWTC